MKKGELLMRWEAVLTALSPFPFNLAEAPSMIHTSPVSLCPWQDRTQEEQANKGIVLRLLVRRYHCT